MIKNNVIGNCKPGFQRKRFQKLKKGELNITFEIDLHGKNLIEAVRKRDQIAIKSFRYMQEKTKDLSF